MIVFISFPYTEGDQAHNVRRAVEIAERVTELGHTPFVPHLFHFWHLLFPHPKRFWMELDKEMLGKCDVVLVLGNESEGVKEEIETADRMGVPVIYTLEDLAYGS